MEPVINGMVADHAVVPVAAPDVPKFVDHFTDVIPAASDAVPETMTDAANVASVDVTGEVIVNVGGAPEEVGVGVGVGVGLGVGDGVGAGVGTGAGVGIGVGVGVGVGVGAGAGITPAGLGAA